MRLGTSFSFSELFARVDPSQGQATEPANVAVRILKRVYESGDGSHRPRGDPVQSSGGPGSHVPVLALQRFGQCGNRCLGLSSDGGQGNANRLAQGRISV